MVVVVVGKLLLLYYMIWQIVVGGTFPSPPRLVSSSQLNSSWLYNEIVANFCKQLTGLDPCQRQEQQHYADEGKGCRLLLTSFRRVHLARSGFT